MGGRGGGGRGSGAAVQFDCMAATQDTIVALTLFGERLIRKW